MPILASDRLQKTRGTKVVAAESCCSTRLEGEVEVPRWLMQHVIFNGAVHSWAARESAEFRRQEENDAKFPENEREVRRRAAASATRRRATRPAQWYARPDPVLVTPMEETAMDVDHAQQLPDSDAVYAWTPRDRVIIKLMTAYLRRDSTDPEGIIGVLARSACDHEGHRRCGAVRRKKTTLMAHVKQYALMRAKQDDEYQELHEVIICMNEWKYLCLFRAA